MKNVDGFQVMGWNVKGGGEARTLAFDAKGRLYAGTAAGIYRTTSPQ
jgi:hypothetical protein